MRFVRLAALTVSAASSICAAPRAAAIPASFSLRPEYERFHLPAQTQQGANCWAYSVAACLELELSRAAGKSVPLSAPYLVWAAVKADADTFDTRGSNFGRAARALERFGICGEAQVMIVDADNPLRTVVSRAAVQEAAALGRNITIDWIRFWKKPIGASVSELNSVKARLAAGHPVAIGMYWPKNLRVADEALCLLDTCKSEDETFDGHCVTLVGYEDNERLPGGGAFLFRNTWGPGWMSQGYARLSYQSVRLYGNDLVSFSVGKEASSGPMPDGQPPANVTGEGVTNLGADQCSLVTGGSLSNSDMKRFKRGVWQSDDQVFFSPKRIGDGFSVDVTVAREGRYTVCIAGTKAPDCGKYRILLDGKRFGAPRDFAWPSVEPTGRREIGRASLTQGRHTLRFVCDGKAQASSGLNLGIDWVSLEPEPADGAG